MGLICVFLTVFLTSGPAPSETRPLAASCQDIQTTYLKARAEHYLLASDFDTALKITNTALQFNANDPALYTLRGQIYLSLYEWGKSLDDYNTALEINSGYTQTYFYRAVLYYSILQTGQELREEALADFQHYLESAPGGQFAKQARSYINRIEAERAALGSDSDDG